MCSTVLTVFNVFPCATVCLLCLDVFLVFDVFCVFSVWWCFSCRCSCVLCVSLEIWCVPALAVCVQCVWLCFNDFSFWLYDFRVFWVFCSVLKLYNVRKSRAVMSWCPSRNFISERIFRYLVCWLILWTNIPKPVANVLLSETRSVHWGPKEIRFSPNIAVCIHFV